ncbi:DUF4124 domain-containing protein [Lysobacteraceae bacterium NML91-0213]|nr:DUF4124 domain-containing protein [Xanthomonadaceae bacterium NML91-0213]
MTPETGMDARLLLGAMLLLVSATAQGQIYRCKGAGGATTYSDKPCGADAELREYRAPRAPEASGEPDSNVRAILQSNEMSSIAIAERRCLGNAESDIYRPVNSRVAGYQREIQQLERQLSGANNNLAGATYGSGIRNQIAALHQSISTERAAADTQMAAARQNCSQQRRDAESRTREKFTTTP